MCYHIYRKVAHSCTASFFEFRRVYVFSQQPVPHVVKSLLGKETDLPTNVFQLNGAGRVHEGMHIELGHPVSNGQPVLMLGEYFILRNNKNGCLYTPVGL